MYQGISVNERDAVKAFSQRMDDKSKGFNHVQLDSYINTCMDGFTEEQKLYMANRIMNDYEEKKRMTMEQDEE